jgi:hypothetical protein
VVGGTAIGRLKENTEKEGFLNVDFETGHREKASDTHLADIAHKSLERHHHCSEPKL